MRNEIIVAAVMIGISLIGSVITRNDKKWATVMLLIAALAGSLVSGMGIRFREIVEGPFAFIDSALCVCMASVFIGLLNKTGTFEKLLSLICRIKSRFFKALALVLFIAFPAMLTGSYSASIMTTGPLAKKALQNGGASDGKTAGIICTSALIGMLMPPNCIPAMIAANGAGSVLPTPYVGFFVPLLILSFPALLAEGLIMMKPLSGASFDTPKEKEPGLIVLAVLALAVVADGLLSSFVYLGGLAFIFFLGSVSLIALNARAWKARNALDHVSDALMMSVGPVAFMLALGSFIEISSMSGVRGFFSLKILPFSVEGVMLALMAAALVVGLFFGESIPAVLTAYAVFPIGWLANPVIVTGIASALALVSMFSFRGGIADKCRARLGFEQVGYKQVLRESWIPCVLVLAIGVAMVLFGDSMTSVIL
jgi:TRAP-type C4-dicarboxylate transport system permease large subunit